MLSHRLLVEKCHKFSKWGIDKFKLLTDHTKRNLSYNHFMLKKKKRGKKRVRVWMGVNNSVVVIKEAEKCRQ